MRNVFSVVVVDTVKSSRFKDLIKSLLTDNLISMTTTLCSTFTGSFNSATINLPNTHTHTHTHTLNVFWELCLRETVKSRHASKKPSDVSVRYRPVIKQLRLSLLSELKLRPHNCVVEAQCLFSFLRITGKRFLDDNNAPTNPPDLLVATGIHPNEAVLPAFPTDPSQKFFFIRPAGHHLARRVAAVKETR